MESMRIATLDPVVNAIDNAARHLARLRTLTTKIPA